MREYLLDFEGNDMLTSATIRNFGEREKIGERGRKWVYWKIFLGERRSLQG